MIANINPARSLQLLKEQSDDIRSVLSELGDKIDALLKQQASLAVVLQALDNEMDRLRSIKTPEEEQLELNFDA